MYTSIVSIKVAQPVWGKVHWQTQSTLMCVLSSPVPRSPNLLLTEFCDVSAVPIKGAEFHFLFFFQVGPKIFKQWFKLERAGLFFFIKWGLLVGVLAVYLCMLVFNCFNCFLIVYWLSFGHLQCLSYRFCYYICCLELVKRRWDVIK